MRGQPIPSEPQAGAGACRIRYRFLMSSSSRRNVRARCGQGPAKPSRPGECEWLVRWIPLHGGDGSQRRHLAQASAGLLEVRHFLGKTETELVVPVAGLRKNAEPGTVATPTSLRMPSVAATALGRAPRSNAASM